MAKIDTQTIPSALRTSYRRSLQFAATALETDYIKKRNPFHAPPRQKAKASDAQLAVRRTFYECTKCFATQPATGGVTPPDVGPRNRSWWYDTALAINPFYPHGKRILGWDGEAQSGQKRPGSDFVYRLTHEYIKVDEQDFIDFYNDMKPLYGYPWSATNDPDEIAFKMWRIIAGEIEYSAKTYVYMALTPGQTSKQAVGDCEDMSILFFALLWKALLETGKNLDWVNSHVSLIYVDLGEVHHVYCWWKDKNNQTRIIECTSKTTDLPADIYGAPEYDTADPTWLFTRVDQVGEYDPWTIKPAEECGQFYYNYFMQQTLNAHFAKTTPDWCRPIPEQDTCAASFDPDGTWGNLHLAVREDIGYHLWGFVIFDTFLMPKTATRYLNLFCDIIISQYWTQYKTFIIDVYEVLEPWQEDVLTWNNKPALGNIISTKSINVDFGSPPLQAVFPNAYHKFTIPNAGSLPYGVCLILRAQTEYVAFQWDSKETAPDSAKVPFISLN